MLGRCIGRLFASFVGVGPQVAFQQPWCGRIVGGRACRKGLSGCPQLGGRKRSYLCPDAALSGSGRCFGRGLRAKVPIKASRAVLGAPCSIQRQVHSARASLLPPPWQMALVHKPGRSNGCGKRQAIVRHPQAAVSMALEAQTARVYCVAEIHEDCP